MFWHRNPTLSLESLDARLRLLESGFRPRFSVPSERAIPRERSSVSLADALESLRRAIVADREKQCRTVATVETD